MAREYGRVWLSIWSDFEFTHLERDVQWLYLALLSQPGMSTCGVLSYAPNRWARLAPKVTGRQVEKWVGALEASRFVVVDRDTDELLIRSHLRYDRPLKTANTAMAVARTWGQIVSPELQKVVLVELLRLHRESRGTDQATWPGWQVPSIKALLATPVGTGVPTNGAAPDPTSVRTPA